MQVDKITQAKKTKPNIVRTEIYFTQSTLIKNFLFKINCDEHIWEMMDGVDEEVLELF